MLALLAMSESSRKTPAFGTKKPLRQQSQDERDAESFAAKRERDAIVKEFSNEEITGRYDGEELVQRRAERTEQERLGRLERKHDDLKRDVQKKHEETNGEIKALNTTVGNLRADVSGAVGKLDGLSTQTGMIFDLVKSNAVAKAEVEKAQDLAKVEIDKEEKIAKVEVAKEQQLDTIDRKQKKREYVLKGMGLLGSIITLFEVLRQIGVF